MYIAPLFLFFSIYVMCDILFAYLTIAFFISISFQL